MYKLVIFDLDGTILNTLGDLTAAVNHTMRTHGFPERTREQVRLAIGDGVRKLVERSIPPDKLALADVDAILADYKARYSAHMEELTKPYRGIPELLRELGRLGIKTAVLSNKYDSATKRLCGRYLPGLIGDPNGEKENVPRKPDPAGIYDILARNGVEKSKTLYVGDGEADVDTAKNAGIFCVGVTWGFRTRELLESHGADAVVSSPEELLAIAVGERK